MYLQYKETKLPLALNFGQIINNLVTSRIIIKFKYLQLTKKIERNGHEDKCFNSFTLHSPSVKQG